MSLPIWFWKAEAGGAGRTYQFWISHVDLGSNALPATRAVWHGANYLTFLNQFPHLSNQVLIPTPNWAELVSEICTKGLTLCRSHGSFPRFTTGKLGEVQQYRAKPTASRLVSWAPSWLGIFHKHQDLCCTLGNWAEWACPQHTHSGRDRGDGQPQNCSTSSMNNILDLLLQWWNVAVSNSLQATCKVLFCWAGNIVEQGREIHTHADPMSVVGDFTPLSSFHLPPPSEQLCYMSALGKQRPRPALKNS